MQGEQPRRPGTVIDIEIGARPRIHFQDPIVSPSTMTSRLLSPDQAEFADQRIEHACRHRGADDARPRPAAARRRNERLLRFAGVGPLLAEAERTRGGRPPGTRRRPAGPPRGAGSRSLSRAVATRAPVRHACRRSRRPASISQPRVSAGADKRISGCGMPSLSRSAKNSPGSFSAAHRLRRVADRACGHVQRRRAVRAALRSRSRRRDRTRLADDAGASSLRGREQRVGIEASVEIALDNRGSPARSPACPCRRRDRAAHARSRRASRGDGERAAGQGDDQDCRGSANDFSRQCEGVAEIEIERLVRLDHPAEQARLDLVLHVADGERPDAETAPPPLTLAVRPARRCPRCPPAARR